MLPDVPTMTPHQYGAYIEEETRRLGANVLILNKPLDSNIRALPGNDPEFWHLPGEYVRRIRDRGVCVVWLTLDDPNDAGFSAATGCLPFCDVVGTCCDTTLDFYPRWNREARVYRFWPAWDPEEFGPSPAPVRPELRCDFVMVGSTYYPKPNPGFGLLRRDVVRAALDAGADVRIYGPEAWLHDDLGGSPDFAPHYRGRANRSDLPSIFASARICYSSWLHKAWGYLTDRVPIIAGAGGFNLMEAQVGLGDTFRHGTHCAYHAPNDIEDVKRQVRWWLVNEDKRRECAEAMRALVLAEHTYEQRAAELDGHVREVFAAREAARARRCCG